MEKVLSIIRWILHKLFLVLLGTTIWLFITSLAVTVNLTDSNQVKLWLTEGNVYQNFSNESLNLIKLEKDGENENTPASPLDEREVINAIRTALPPEFLQEQAEEVIDGIYAWLNNETGGPEFSISLESQKPEIKQALTEELKRQVKDFPECTPDQVLSSSFDPFESQCIPPGTDVDKEVERVVDNFMNEEDSIFNQQFTGNDLDLDYDTELNGPVYFDTLELLPFFYWTFLAGMSALVVLTARNWKRGIKEVGAAIIGSTLFLVIFSFITQRLADVPGRYVIQQDASDSEGEAVRIIFEPLAKVAVRDFAATTLFFSLITLVIGIVLFAIGWKIAPKLKVVEVEKDGSKPEGDNSKDKNQDDVPELMKDDGNENNVIDRMEAEKQAEEKARQEAAAKKPTSKLKQKIKNTKNKLIQ